MKIKNTFNHCLIIYLGLHLCSLLNGCKSRYTTVENYQDHNNIPRQEIASIKGDPYEKYMVNESLKYAEPIEAAHKKTAVAKPRNKKIKKSIVLEKTDNFEAATKPIIRLKRKEKEPRKYVDPKYSKLNSAFAVNALMIWAIGYFIIGIGSIMHIFLLGAIGLAILSFIQRH